MRRLTAYLFALMAAVACVSANLENEKTGMDPSLEGKPVTITFSIPDVRVARPTKGVEEAGVGLIGPDPYLDPDKLYLVVCGHSQSIKYIRKAQVEVDASGNPVAHTVSVSEITDYPLTDKPQTVDVYSFTVQLELSDSDRTIHILGNIDENQLITGSYSYQILPTLLSYEGKQAFWQKIYLEHIHPRLDGNDNPIIQNDGSYLPDKYTVDRLKYIPLIRNFAKIQVTNNTAEADKFELFSYAVVNYPKQGSVVPYRSNAVSSETDHYPQFSFPYASDYYSANYRLSGYEKCSFSFLDENLDYLGHLPSTVGIATDIPTEYLFEHPDNKRVIEYKKGDTEQGIFLFERGVPKEKPTFVIIRGRFGTNEYYYYRLDLMETKTVDHESVAEYYPIYRNFRYNIQVNRISSQGVSSPEAAANSSGAEDISADISMKHLSDISNGQTRLVVEPFMAQTYTGPSEDGYYYLYARFFNDLNDATPNTTWGDVKVELLPLEDSDEDILYLYNDVGNPVQWFFPEAQEGGFRIIRFNTKEAGDETVTQKIRITGSNSQAHEDFPLYRDVEISLQKKQNMKLKCTEEIPLVKGYQQVLDISIPSGLPTSMFPLEFTIEAEDNTLTPDNNVLNNNLPVKSGISISDNPGYAGKNTIQFIRTLTLEEYETLPVNEGLCTFQCVFKTNRSESETTIWVANKFFIKTSVSFINQTAPTNQFWVLADAVKDCYVRIDMNNLQYRLDEGEWQNYTSTIPILLEHTHKVAFRSTQTIQWWNGGNKFYCYEVGSGYSARNGTFSVGGNIASLLVGDNYETEGPSYSLDFSMAELFKNHVNLTDASQLELPMLTCRSNCYKSMFEGCKNLTKGPAVLPATKLDKVCYRNMFYNCAKLVDAPILAAENITGDCYQRMFYGCSSLKLIKMNSKEYKSGAFNSDGTTWVKNVAALGEIWLNPAIASNADYVKVVPQGWTVKRMPDGADW